MSTTSVQNLPHLPQLLTAGEIAQLNGKQQQMIESFLSDTDFVAHPEKFDSVDLSKLACRATCVMSSVLRANPNWSKTRVGNYAALIQENGLLLAQGEKTLPPMPNPTGVAELKAWKKSLTPEQQELRKKIKASDLKLSQFKSTLDQKDLPCAVRARQWDCDKISKIKARLAQAIQLQKNYYESTWMGWIAKCFLKLTCRWNEGNTPSIEMARDTLYHWDFQMPLDYNGGNAYREGNMFYHANSNKASKKEFAKDSIGFAPWLHASWVQKHLNTAGLYNYPKDSIQVITSN